MNKLTKAAIAGAAGIALLLGGAGSLAYWNSSATISGATVSSGSLNVTAAGAWNTTITKWVPGDSVTYTGTITVTAVGDNFKGELTFNNASVTGDPDLKAALANTFTVTASVTGVTTSAPGVYTITGAGTYTIPVTLKVEFPYGSAVANETQSQSVDLSSINFNVKQILP